MGPMGHFERIQKLTAASNGQRTVRVMEGSSAW